MDDETRRQRIRVHKTRLIIAKLPKFPMIRSLDEVFAGEKRFNEIYKRVKEQECREPQPKVVTWGRRGHNFFGMSPGDGKTLAEVRKAHEASSATAELQSKKRHEQERAEHALLQAEAERLADEEIEREADKEWEARWREQHRVTPTRSGMC